MNDQIKEIKLKVESDIRSFLKQQDISVLDGLMNAVSGLEILFECLMLSNTDINEIIKKYSDERNIPEIFIFRSIYFCSKLTEAYL